MSKLKPRQKDVISKLYTKMQNYDKIPSRYLVYTVLNLNNYFCPIFSCTFTQKEHETFGLNMEHIFFLKKLLRRLEVQLLLSYSVASDYSPESKNIH